MKKLTKLSALLCLFFLTKSHELDKLNYDIKKFSSKRDGTSSSQLTSEEKSKKDYGFIENLIVKYDRKSSAQNKSTLFVVFFCLICAKLNRKQL